MSRRGQSPAYLEVFFNDSRTEACSFCHVTFSELPEALSAKEIPLQLIDFIKVVLYVYFMHQTEDITNISF